LVHLRSPVFPAPPSITWREPRAGVRPLADFRPCDGTRRFYAPTRLQTACSLSQNTLVPAERWPSLTRLMACRSPASEALRSTPAQA
jgi:hypothetical protein